MAHARHAGLQIDMHTDMQTATDRYQFARIGMPRGRGFTRARRSDTGCVVGCADMSVR